MPSKPKAKIKITKGPSTRVLAANAKTVRKKFTKAERAEHNRVAALAEAEFPPKPVSAAKVAIAKLRNTRQLAEISLDELAKRTGMAKANLSRLENKGDNATVATLERYAEGLGFSIVIDIEMSPAKEHIPVADRSARPVRRSTKKKMATVTTKKKPAKKKTSSKKRK